MMLLYKNNNLIFPFSLSLSLSSGHYRGAACQECNGKMRLRDNFLPVFIHNLRGYDSHIICAEALGKIKKWNMSVVAQTMEKYMALSAEFEVRPAVTQGKSQKKAVNMMIGFRDSYQFLTDSLAKLVGNLSPDQLVHTRTLFKSEEDFKAVALSKGVFPYCHLTGPECLNDTELPNREAFFDELSQQECSPANYQRAQESWRRLKCRTFGDYMLAYLQLDVHQLADVFETFRQLTLREDGLDPAYYLTLPGLSWDSAFKMTGAKVKLLLFYFLMIKHNNKFLSLSLSLSHCRSTC